MLTAKYVRQLGKRKGFEDLAKGFFRAPHAAINDIAILAMKGGCKQSLNFLIKRGLAHPEMDVRYLAVDYLCDLPKKHSQMGKVAKAVNAMVCREKNDRLQIFALERYAILQKRLPKKTSRSSSRRSGELIEV